MTLPFSGPKLPLPGGVPEAPCLLSTLFSEADSTVPEKTSAFEKSPFPSYPSPPDSLGS